METPMRHQKILIRVLPFVVLLILLASGLNACSQKTTQDELSVSGETLSAPLPTALLTVDATNLVVKVVDLDGKLNNGEPLLCDKLSVDQNNGTFSCKILLPAGTYTLALEYSIKDTNYAEPIIVASTSGIGVDVIAGKTTKAEFGGVTLNYDYDKDRDNIKNLMELDEGSNPNTPSYYIGGTVSGLVGNGAVIQINDGDINLPLSSDGNFRFIPAVDNNTTYTVTVVTQPVGQTCNVSNESGTVSGANVTDVNITCTDIDTTAPSVVSSFNEPIIDVLTRFSVGFDETMDRQSLVFSGDLADEATASWSQGTVVDDTVTIEPTAAWPIGVGQSLTIDVNDLAGNPLTTLTLVFDVSVIHVSANATNANDSNPGTRNLPLETIQAAVNLANNNLTKSEIRVARGTYSTFSELGNNIVVSDGMRLMGGYSADWVVRNSTTFPTAVKDMSTTGGGAGNPNCVLVIAAGAESQTLVDGFILTGGGGDESCGIKIDLNASPTISNNIISGGSSTHSSTGVIDRGFRPVIQNNSIRGNESNPQALYVVGISSSGSSPTITKNNIIGGYGYETDGHGIGISLDSVNAIVNQNAVVGASSDNSSGVSISGSSTVILRNNTIYGGNAYATTGVEILGGGSTATLQNNTIFSGNGAQEIALYIGSPAIIENNIFFGNSGIYEAGIGADPLRLFNNNLYGSFLPHYFYYDYDAQCTGNADGDNDAHTCTVAEMNALLDIPVGDNINVNLGFGTQADADWHLSATSPASVKFGGLDLSVYFTTDKDGVERTAPWSIGAYEQN